MSRSSFKIAAAQIGVHRGEFAKNFEVHVAAIAAAAKYSVSMLIFPELSLTGYEPALAAEFAIHPTDCRLAGLAQLANQHQLSIVLGTPLKNNAGKPELGAVNINSQGDLKTYSKMHLGGNEAEFFSAGRSPLILQEGTQKIGLAICADSSQPAHPQIYSRRGANIYAISVFLNAEWFATDVPRLATYAARHRVLVVMANHGASQGTYQSAGKSTIWAPTGSVLAQAAGVENALVIATRQETAWSAEVVAI